MKYSALLRSLLGLTKFTLATAQTNCTGTEAAVEDIYWRNWTLRYKTGKSRNEDRDRIGFLLLYTDIAASQFCEPDPVCLCKSKLTAEVNPVFPSIKKRIVHHMKWRWCLIFIQSPLLVVYYKCNTCVNICLVGKWVSPLWP